MTKYTRVERKREERPWQINPAWRGIGCLMILLIILMSYAAADLLVQANNQTYHWTRFPANINAVVVIPRIQIPYTIIDFTIGKISLLGSDVRYITLIFWGAFLFVGFGILTVLYAIIYRFLGPPRYNRFDSPPVRTPRYRK